MSDTGYSWAVRVLMGDGTTPIMARYKDRAEAERGRELVESEGYRCRVEQLVNETAPRGKVDRRRELIESTKEELAANGWSGVTLSSVGKRANLSAASVLNYFQSKEALLKSTLQQMMEDFDSIRNLRISRAPDDPLNIICSLVETYIGHCDPKLLGIWAMYRAEAMDWFIEIVIPPENEDLKLMRKAFGSLTPDYAETNSLIMQCLLHGTFRQITTGEFTPQQARAVYSALRALSPPLDEVRFGAYAN